MNINIGDLINQTGFTHYTPSLQVRFAAPKGRVAVMLLLGDADKKAPETFDATAALNNLGWIAETELEDSLSQLAALREELSELEDEFDTLENTNIDIKLRLADAERRNAPVLNIEEAAKTLACCMDYPWEHMPENGRALMRKHAKDVVDAALNPNPEAASHDE